MFARLLLLLHCSLVTLAHVSPFQSGTAFPNSQHLMFETVKAEAEGTIMPVTFGKFPSWMVGSKYNNGFGQFESCPAEGCFAINHLADVMSYYTRIDISNGTVRLWDKIQRTKYWQEAQKQKPIFRNFNGTTPGFTPAEQTKVLTEPFNVNDNLNVAIIQLTTSGRMFGVSDMKGFNEADSDMNYVGWLEFEEKNKPPIAKYTMLGVDMVTCAHIGNTLGDHYVYGFNYLLFDGLENDLAVWRIDMTQEDHGAGTKLVREWLDKIKMPSMMDISYMHTFANTKNYLVFVGSVFEYSMMGIMEHSRILKAMEYHADKNNSVWVFEKASGKFIKTFSADPFWFYHLVNVYEDGQHVVLDINAVDYRHITTAFSNEKLRYDYPWEFEAKPTIQLRVDVTAPEGTHFSPTVMGPSYDLGIIHPNLHGQKYQYAYGLAWSGKHLWWDKIIKHDVTTNEVTATWHRDDHYPGELNAIAKPGAEHEDDVVILALVLGGDYGTSYLLALDGRDLSPIAEARSHYPLPFGSHGCWQSPDKKHGCVSETTADPFGKPAVFKRRGERSSLTMV